MNLKGIALGASMLSMAACADKAPVKLTRPIGDIERVILQVKGKVGREPAYSILHKDEVVEAFGFDSMDSIFEERRPYHIEGNNVVYCDKNSSVFDASCCFIGQERDVKLPIKDIGSFRHPVGNILVEEMIIFDGKFYFAGKHFPQIDAASAMVENEEYLVDKNGVYIYGYTESIDREKAKHGDVLTEIPAIRKIEGVDPSSFSNCAVSQEYIAYVKTAFNEKEQEFLLRGCERSYKTDLQSVIYRGEKIPADPRSFKVAFGGGDYGYDEKYLFYRGKKIEGFDVSKLRAISADDDKLYVTDGKKIVYKGKALKGCDPSTFALTRFITGQFESISIDKNTVYHGSEISKGESPYQYGPQDLYPGYDFLLPHHPEDPNL